MGDEIGYLKCSRMFSSRLSGEKCDPLTKLGIDEIVRYAEAFRRMFSKIEKFGTDK